MEKQSEKSQIWKSNCSILYDYVFAHSLEWPCTSCRWSSVQSSTNSGTQQQLFFGLRTDGSYKEKQNHWEGMGSFLAMGEVLFPNPGYYFTAESISAFKTAPKRHINVTKVLLHPGEVNTIKTWNKNPNIIGTHSDSSYVFIWDMQRQPNSEENKDIPASLPDLILEGHVGMAPYALAWSPNSPIVASGGYDHNVMVWDLEGYFNSSGSISPTLDSRHSALSEFGVSASNMGLGSHMELREDKAPRRLKENIKLTGHTGHVEGVSFHPFNQSVLASVAVDRQIIVWDTRESNRPAQQMGEIHSNDINCIDWSTHDSNFLLTGSSDQSANITDLRKGMPLTSNTGHSSPVTCVQFAPFSSSVVASADQDLLIWDFKEEIGSNNCLFRHSGHISPIVDFEWNFNSPWSILSGSDNSANPMGGGSLQLFRPLELLVLPETQALQRIQNILSGDK